MLAFAVVLLVAIAISGIAHRTVLSATVLFLVAGFVLGDGITGLVSLKPDDEIVSTVAELALFTVLFTDGQQIGARDLRAARKLPGRALLLGMPLTFAITSVLGVLLLGLSWPEALLVAAVLAPTDRSSPPQLWAVERFRGGFGTCSMSNPGSTMGWPCRWFSC